MANRRVEQGQTVTMVDVARKARVALRTVSRVVNGANVRPDLVARVEDAIALLGYRRNLIAASIRPGWSSKVIAFLVSDLSNPHYWWLARHIEAHLRAKGYLLITAGSEDGTSHDALVERLMEQRVDGLIISPACDAVRSWTDVPPPVPPLVFIDRPGDGLAGADAIVSDDFGGARVATGELARHGARRIAFLGGAPSIYAIQERHRGYLAALDDAGVHPVEGDQFFSAATTSAAAKIATDLLRSGEADAIFAANNRASVGALHAFSDGGRRLPLVGFDDFEAARVVSPGISVVNQDPSGMGQLAAEMMLARLSGDHAGTGRTHTVPVSLILRGSERADP